MRRQPRKSRRRANGPNGEMARVEWCVVRERGDEWDESGPLQRELRLRLRVRAGRDEGDENKAPSLKSGRVRLFGGLEPAAQDEYQRLDGEFDEQKRLGDQIAAAAHGRVGAALEVGHARDEDDGSGFVERE